MSCASGTVGAYSDAALGQAPERKPPLRAGFPSGPRPPASRDRRAYVDLSGDPTWPRKRLALEAWQSPVLRQRALRQLVGISALARPVSIRDDRQSSVRTLRFCGGQWRGVILMLWCTVVARGICGVAERSRRNRRRKGARRYDQLINADWDVQLPDHPRRAAGWCAAILAMADRSDLVRRRLRPPRLDVPTSFKKPSATSRIRRCPACGPGSPLPSAFSERRAG